MAEIGPSFPLWLNAAAAAVSRRPRTHYKTHLGTAGLSEGGRTSQFEIKKCWEELLFYLNNKRGISIQTSLLAFPPVTIYSFCAAFLAVSIYWEFGPVVLVYEITMLSCNI